jgi:YVTN family beta-propeller protein
MPRVAVLAAVLLIGIAATGTKASTVFVADEEGGSVTVIDTGSGLSRRVGIPISPHNVDLTPDGKRLLATGAGTGLGEHAGHGAPGGRLVVMDLSEQAPQMQAIDLGGHPAHVVADAEGRFAYVTDADTNSVVVADLLGMTIVARIPVGSSPHGLRLSPDGRTLAVANIRSGTVSLVDIAERKRVADIDVGRRPVQVGFDPSGRTLVVSLNGENKMGVIDVPARKLAWKAEVGRGPVQVIVTPDGKRALVANQGAANNPDDRLSVVSLSARKSVAKVRVGKGAHGVAVAPDGATAYVTNTYADTVSAVDLGALTVRSTYTTGKAPNGITVR